MYGEPTLDTARSKKGTKGWRGAFVYTCKKNAFIFFSNSFFIHDNQKLKFNLQNISCDIRIRL